MNGYVTTHEAYTNEPLPVVGSPTRDFLTSIFHHRKHPAIAMGVLP